MKQFVSVLVSCFFVVFAFADGARAGDAPASNPYSGDIWSRSTLSGDWWGLRNELAAKGVTLDMSLTQAAQGIVHGGKDSGWQFSGGRGDITLNLDSQKLGLWPGGFLNLEAEGNFIPADNLLKSINGKSGGLMFVNSSQIYPTPAGDNFNLPALNFTQFLSPYFGLTIGKYATITGQSGDMNEFAHGKGDNQFMNLAMNINPVLLTTVPYSTLGTGVILLPTRDPHQAIVNVLIISSTGKASTSGFEDLDGNNITLIGEGRVRTDFFGLTGHQLFGAAFSNRKFSSIDQNARFVFENGAFEEKKGSWNLYYNFDQYLYEPKKGSGEGIGVFARLGASDGDPNFMHFFYSLGIGGKGVIPRRENDRYGFGFYYIDTSNPKLQGLFRGVKLLRDEYGFEAFYNIAITPWLQLTPDIQVVRGAQQEKIKIGQNLLGLPTIASRKSVGASTILGLRLQMVF
ncbi:MAG TPA: carbohydrate porin [Terriglobales bacterium]|nr:carbohydrate porin [Terriglobales bacterium]